MKFIDRFDGFYVDIKEHFIDREEYTVVVNQLLQLALKPQSRFFFGTWKLYSKSIHLASGNKSKTGRKILSILKPFFYRLEIYALQKYPKTVNFLRNIPIHEDNKIGIWPQATFLYNKCPLKAHKDTNNLPGSIQFTLVFGEFTGANLLFDRMNISFHNQPTLVCFKAGEQSHSVTPILSGHKFSLQLFTHFSLIEALYKNK